MSEETNIYIIQDEMRGTPTFIECSPHNAGRWKSIISVDDINDAEYLIVINTPMGIDISGFPPENILYFRREPDAWRFLQHLWDNLHPASHTYPNKDSWMMQRWQNIHKTYDELKNSKFPNKTKDLSFVTTNYGDGTQEANIEVLPGHKLRIQFLQRFLKKCPNGPMDLYGHRLSGPLYRYPCNKGSLWNKWWGLQDYRYTFAFENAYEEGYFTEKIGEAILAGCMPIFWGCPNIETLFPEGSFIRIDITREDAVERAIEIAQSDFREQHIDELYAAKQLVLDKYNIFPSIEMHINKLREGVQ